MRVFLVILVLIFSACSDSGDTQQATTNQTTIEAKSQNDALDSSKTIKPQSSSNIIDDADISSATTNATDSATNIAVESKSTESKVAESITKPDGATLYAKCAVCHGAKGEKVAPGSEGNVLLSKLSKDSIISDLKGYRAKTLKKGKSSAIMYLQSANLSDADIESLGEYIASFSK